MLHAKYFQKTLHFLRNRHFFLFWGGFVSGLYGGGLTGKCRSFVRNINFWPARHTPPQFSRKVQRTHYLLHMRFLDSWLHGASAGYRVGEV
jgi:hypothetical protein